MRLRDRRSFTKPEVMIIPMIDIMFFLLVFFMISTLYMVNLKTVDVSVPKAASAQTQMNVTYLVTLKKDGTLYLEDKPIEEKALIQQAKQESRANSHFAVVVRADEGIDYGRVVDLLDHFRSAGISRFGPQLTRAGSEVPMVREEREKAASWGISAAVHLVILLLVTATGLFQAVSSESHPVDVEIYDNVTEDEQPPMAARQPKSSPPQLRQLRWKRRQWPRLSSMRASRPLRSRKNRKSRKSRKR